MVKPAHARHCPMARKHPTGLFAPKDSGVGFDFDAILSKASVVAITGETDSNSINFRTRIGADSTDATLAALQEFELGGPNSPSYPNLFKTVPTASPHTKQP